jgi:PAS domain S-box-containing protein
MKITGDDMELRREAERMLDQANKAAKDLAGIPPQDIANLVHELRVHQIELKMQNDELRRIQAELEKARDRYVHLYDFAPTAYFTVDEKGAITEANLTAATLLARPRADLVGQMFSRFIHRDDQDVWYHHRKHLLETGDFQSFQLRLVKTTVVSFTSNLECMRAADSNGEPKAIRISATDVTGLKQAEQALQQANTTLEQRVAERTVQVGQRNAQLQKLALELSNAEDRERRRIAMILHDDLQQGLASARFRLWNIVPREKIDAQVEKNIVDLENDLAQSIQISRSLSTVLSPPVLQQHGLKAALAWLAKDMQSGHGLSVTFDIGQHIEPESVALASVLFRMVKELLFNVVKHAGVTSAHMDAHINGNMIVISVQDHGKGFDAADLQVRQDVFGLFSIKERINVLGGTFTIDSSPGTGCRVTLSVPREELSHLSRIESINAPSSDQPALNTVSGSPIASVGEQNVRIIIADDHSTMREGLAHLLKDKDGLEVIAQAGDGRQVIGLAKELNPDLILMDVSMPGLDGIQATAHISRVQPDICIIGLSMHDDRTTHERMLSAGAAAHLSKSTQAKELLESIRRIATQWARRNNR